MAIIRSITPRNGVDGTPSLEDGCLLLHQFRHDYGLPVLNVVVEGTRDSGQDIRMEAFFHQCHEHLRHRQLKR